jgi:hypothetical protein
MKEDTSNTLAVATPVSDALGETVGLSGLQNLAGLVEDLMDRNITNLEGNVEEAVRQRLGPNATLEDAKNAIQQLDAALVD